jgi:hypothetical protein
MRASGASTPSDLHTKCPKHGERPWKNTIACRLCRRVFLMEVAPGTPRAAPERCPCGAELLPEKRGERPRPFTGIPVCSLCFTDACDHAGGFAR